jgi:hypothetical protein
MIGMVHETAAALETLYGRCEPQDGEIIFTDKGKKQTKRAFPIGSTKAIIEAADAMNGNCDHYWKVNLMDADAMRERSRRENKGNYLVGNLSEVKTVVCFALDCDAGKGEYLSREKMLGCLARMPQPPTMIINSDGDEGGFHAYWCLAEPYRVGDDRGRNYIAELSKRWQDRLNVLTGGKLDSTADLTRFLRVIGQPRSNGRFVTCHEVHPRRLYSLDELTIKPDRSQRCEAAKRNTRNRIFEKLGAPKHSNDVVDRASKYLSKIEGSVSGAGGHNQCFKAACVLVLGFDLPDEIALRILLEEFNPRCQPEWSEKELEHKVRQASRQAGARGYLLGNGVVA